MVSLHVSFNPLKSQKATRWTLLGIIWVAFLLRTLTLGSQSLWRDEVDTVFFSTWRVKHLLLELLSDGQNGPLYYLLLRPWQEITGNSEFAIRYPSALMGTLVIPLGYAVARQLQFSKRAGLLLSLLLATSPYLIWYGQEAKMYTLLLATITFAFIAYLKAMFGNGTKWWIIFVAATSISFYLHILSPLMLLVYGAVAIIFYPRLRLHWQAWLLSMACLTLPYVPLVIWQFSYFLEGSDRGHPFYPFKQEIYLLLQLYSSGLTRFVSLTAIVLFVFLFLGGMFLVNPRAKRENLTLQRRLVLAAWVLIPPVAIYLVSLRVPIFEDRYLIYITPGFYLIIVLGIILIRQHSSLLAGLCLGLILVINLMGIWHQQKGPIKPNFRAAAEYLANQPYRPATIMIQIPYLERTFNYYYPYPYTFLEGVWTNGEKTEIELHNEMSRLTANQTDLWLVVSEEELWDNRKMVRSWLDEHADLNDTAHFTRVTLYRYQFRPGTIDAQTIISK